MSCPSSQIRAAAATTLRRSASPSPLPEPRRAGSRPTTSLRPRATAACRRAAAGNAWPGLYHHQQILGREPSVQCGQNSTGSTAWLAQNSALAASCGVSREVV